MSVSDLLMKMGYLGAGGDQESSLDKVNRTIGTVGKLFTDMSARKQQNLQDKLNALKLEEAKANIAKAQAENAPIGSIMPKITVTQPMEGYTAGQEAPDFPKGFDPRLKGMNVGQYKNYMEAVKAGQPKDNWKDEVVPVSEQWAKLTNGLYKVGDMATKGDLIEAGKTGRSQIMAESNPQVPLREKGSGLKIGTVGKKDVFTETKPPKAMSDKTKDIFSGLMDSLSAIETSAGYVSGDKVRVGEGTNLYKLSNIPGAGLARGLTGTPEENELMANLTKAQSSFYKAQTGAQRGMKEIAFLSPAMPQAGTQNKENFLATAKSSAKSIADNFVRAYRLSEKQGQDMSEYKPTYDQIISSYGEPSPIGGINTPTAGVETPQPSVKNPPQPGTEDNGFIFMGGNPASPSSWRKK